MVIAALTSVAFYLSALDNWAAIHFIGLVVVFGAAFAAFMFILGFLLHAVGVLLHAQRVTPEVQAESPETVEPRPT